MRVIRIDEHHTISIHETVAGIDVGCTWAQAFGIANVFEGIHHCPFCGDVVDETVLAAVHPE